MLQLYFCIEQKCYTLQKSSHSCHLKNLTLRPPSDSLLDIWKFSSPIFAKFIFNLIYIIFSNYFNPIWDRVTKSQQNFTAACRTHNYVYYSKFILMGSASSYISTWQLSRTSWSGSITRLIHWLQTFYRIFENNYLPEL